MIDADTDAACRCHAVLERQQKIGVHFLVLFPSQASGFLHSPQLVKWIVEFREGIREFHAAHVQLESFDGVRVVRLSLRQQAAGKVNGKSTMNVGCTNFGSTTALKTSSTNFPRVALGSTGMLPSRAICSNNYLDVAPSISRSAISSASVHPSRRQGGRRSMSAPPYSTPVVPRTA